MTTTTFNAAPTNSADADFRAWGSGLSAAFTAVGLVKTADTGQINWTTVLKPSGAATYQGYEIWRFNDALQATAPIFFKVEFGSGGGATSPGLRLTVGKASDGAGTITGSLVPATVVAASGPNAGVTPWYVASGDGSMLAVAPAPTTMANFNLWLERSRNAAGAATAAGITFGCQNAATPVNVRTANYAATTARTDIRFPAVIPGGASVGLAVGGKAPVFAGTVADPLGNFWQPRVVLVGQTSDVGSLAAITVPGWGTYLPVANWTNYDAAGSAAAVGCMAWS